MCSDVLTIFAVPKPFEGHIATIQRNAIESWARLEPACQVILCGDETGSGEVAAELGVEHIADVGRNDYGTPLLSSAFERAEERARYDLLCYLNSDLLLFPDFLDSVRRVAAALTRFVVVGETIDLDVRQELTNDDDYEALRGRALTSGVVRGRRWIDFFAFPKGTVRRLPAFAVGRPYWDNWMIWHARSSRVPVVDVSASAVVVHQHHDYGHVKHATAEHWLGPEAEANRELVGSKEMFFTLDEATLRLEETGLVPIDHGGVLHRVGIELRLHRWTIPFYRVLRSTYKRSRRTLARD
jgi:hypothetical protein